MLWWKNGLQNAFVMNPNRMLLYAFIFISFVGEDEDLGPTQETPHPLSVENYSYDDANSLQVSDWLIRQFLGCRRTVPTGPITLTLLTYYLFYHEITLYQAFSDALILWQHGKRKHGRKVARSVSRSTWRRAECSWYRRNQKVSKKLCRLGPTSIHRKANIYAIWSRKYFLYEFIVVSTKSVG